MLRVGLTGGIATGKSTVAAAFRKLGAPVLDADGVARELCEPGEPGLVALVDALGISILDASGRLDRVALRRRVFSDNDLRRKVEALLHPLILERMENIVAGLEAPYCILEIPLLAESGRARELVDRILVVDCPERIQVARLRARDHSSQAEAVCILAAQASREDRLAIADDILDNTGTLDALEDQIRTLDAQYRGDVPAETGGT